MTRKVQEVEESSDDEAAGAVSANPSSNPWLQQNGSGNTETILYSLHSISSLVFFISLLSIRWLNINVTNCTVNNIIWMFFSLFSLFFIVFIVFHCFSLFNLTDAVEAVEDNGTSYRKLWNSVNESKAIKRKNQQEKAEEEDEVWILVHCNCWRFSQDRR